MNARAVVIKILLNVVVHQRSLTDALSQAFIQSSEEQPFIQALCYGVCRWYFRLDAIARPLLSKPLKEKDQDIYLLILMGLYQLTDMRLPAYAAVSETVAVADALKKPWAKPLVNAILRRFQREPILPAEKNLEAVYAHPDWLIEKIQQDWPTQWSSILTANNQHPPLSLRVNLRKITREHYLQALAKVGIAANPIPATEAGISLVEPLDVHQIPGFVTGEVSVQDGAAQYAASLLQLQAGQRVLDACCAPGGKTAHLLEKANIELIAIDQDAHRLQAVEENLQRLSLHAHCQPREASVFAQAWTGSLFDRILLDAPCSATGVIRRHPDIKLLRHAADIPRLAKEQLRLLNALWPILKPGGLLLYATCSILKEENRTVVHTFLSSSKEAKSEGDWQLLPGMQGMDGFYYHCLRK